jgi:peptide/nickel transport system permease protein
MSALVHPPGVSRVSSPRCLLRRRLIQAVPLMLGVVVINFCLIQLAPGSAAG